MRFKTIGLGVYLLFCLNIYSCSSENEATEPKASQPPSYTLPSGKAIYIPWDLRSNDFTQKDSQWSYYRMTYSDNFVVFWEKGFGTTPSTTTDKSMQVDIQDLLKKAELFYDINVNKLKFVTSGQSNTDKYRMMIFLKYQTEWLATGSGYDDVIGALAKQAGAAGYEVLMVTPDKDYGQLDSGNIKIYIPPYQAGSFEILGP